MFKLEIKIVIILGAIGLALSNQRAPAQTRTDPYWRPYSAKYVASFSSTNAAGESSTKETVYREVRTATGAMLTVQEKDGKAVSGRIWRADGQMVSLDYVSRRAVETKQAPRVHATLPTSAPTGTRTVSGISCQSYPVHMRDGGSGEICIDTANDILVRQEIHLNSGGIQQDSVKELASIDLSTPVDDSTVAVPPGFATFNPSER